MQPSFVPSLTPPDHRASSCFLCFVLSFLIPFPSHAFFLCSFSTPHTCLHSLLLSLFLLSLILALPHLPHPLLLPDRVPLFLIHTLPYSANPSFLLSLFNTCPSFLLSVIILFLLSPSLIVPLLRLSLPYRFPHSSNPSLQYFYSLFLTSVSPLFPNYSLPSFLLSVALSLIPSEFPAFLNPFLPYSSQ